MMSKHRIAWAAVLAASLALPGAAVFVWRDAWWPLVVFVLWNALAAALFIAFDRRHMQRRHERLVDHAQRAAVDMLSHHRHDWMNEVQILYGYLKLKKYEKAMDVVDRIRNRMERDSRISRIGIPSLAVYLLSFRAAGHAIHLEAEIEDSWNPDLIGPHQDNLTGAVAALVNVIRVHAAAAPEEPYVLRLRFGAEGRRVRLGMVYEGELIARDSIAKELEQALKGFGNLTEEWDGGKGAEGRLRWTIAFPLCDKAEQPA